MRAANALHTERFVRRNVSHRKFLEWMQENPRVFTTERELQYLASKAALQSSCTGQEDGSKGCGLHRSTGATDCQFSPS